MHLSGITTVVKTDKGVIERRHENRVQTKSIVERSLLRVPSSAAPKEMAIPFERAEAEPATEVQRRPTEIPILYNSSNSPNKPTYASR